MIAERRSQRQMKEEPPSLIDVLARFEEDNPHSRKVLCNLLSGGSGGRTRNYERNYHNKAHTPHGWEGFDGMLGELSVNFVASCSGISSPVNLVVSLVRVSILSLRLFKRRPCCCWVLESV